MENNFVNIVYFWLGRKAKYGIFFLARKREKKREKVKYLFWIVLKASLKIVKPTKWRVE